MPQPEAIDSILIPGSVWHYGRCMKCGDSFMPDPPRCYCGGRILPMNEPAPDTTVSEDWMMIFE
jgi:hypothetical protein